MRHGSKKKVAYKKILFRNSTWRRKATPHPPACAPSTLRRASAGSPRCPWQERACRAGLRALVLGNVPVPALTETRPRQALDATRQPACTHARTLHIRPAHTSVSACVLFSRAPPPPPLLVVMSFQASVPDDALCPSATWTCTTTPSRPSASSGASTDVCLQAAADRAILRGAGSSVRVGPTVAHQQGRKDSCVFSSVASKIAQRKKM